MAALYRTLTGQSQKSHHSEHSHHSHAHSHSHSHSNIAHPVLTRTTTTDPLTGTLNHLTPVQEEKLEEFKAELLKDGWWSPDSVNGKATHDDGTLLRYLRARKFDVQGAIGQFTDTEKWMKEQHVVELYDHFDVDIYEKARLMYPQWTGHRDRRGIPIYVFEIKGLDSKNVSKYQKESEAYKKKLPLHKNLSTPAKLIPLFALYQNLLNFVLPFVSTLERPNPEVPVTTSTNIVDITGVGLTQFWNLKGHMQDASILATAHYPETLDRIFIIGAPAFFPTVWGWIKRWFDPVTVSKIFILGKHEVKPTLEKFMDPKDFPKKYGGELEWNWGELPDLDAETRAALEKDGNKGWVTGPCLWLDGQRLVVGSQDGTLRKPDSEVEKHLPIVYAADYTDVPVHPDRKLSKASEKARLSHAANGTAEPHHIAESETAKVAPDGATTATVIAAQTKPTSSQTQLDPEKLEGKNIHSSPASGSAVHLPTAQAAHPAVTAEYISSNNNLTAQELHEVPVEDHPHPSQSVPVESRRQSQTHSRPSTAGGAPHVAALPQSGPISEHAEAMNKAVVEGLSGESVSEIPATANGHSTEGHAEVLIASDGSKGLAIEQDKLDRPPMERFVTAGTGLTS
ncbi:hypothetical protein PV10_05952 [Exophiala mesophila]|uniref:CRAL-TRIO domain-containing protein n=1 Tax=Exophiala mesophila TaxID=212818 RepID=A0A0D1ZBT8_EXOME|nr:uncharacterized protein PV10_05952 [Exophiala mesophila]KIV91409.1 hypothetical protein PV10_05952 [Exophiala mesophila]